MARRLRFETSASNHCWSFKGQPSSLLHWKCLFRLLEARDKDAPENNRRLWREDCCPTSPWHAAVTDVTVDIETLEILAKLGIEFTILVPRQARQEGKIGGRSWKDVSGERIDPSMPYLSESRTVT